MKIKAIFTIMMAGAIVFGCEKEHEAETVPAYNLTGEWMVQTYFGVAHPDSVVLGYVPIVTSNTAANTAGEILIDDHGNIWPFKVKCPANADARTFAGTSLLNLADTSVTVTISNGRVIEDGATPPSGNAVDSIYFEAEFSDHPGFIYILAGHYRTGFEEDEHL